MEQKSNGLKDRSNSYKSKNFIFTRIKPFIKSRLGKHKTIETIIKNIWHLFWFSLLEIRWGFWKVLTRFWQGVNIDIDNNKTYWVSPKKIVFSTYNPVDCQKLRGKILGGPWDLIENRFDTNDVYIAIKDVCIERGKWEDTLFYKRAVGRLKKGQIFWDCHNENDLIQKCRSIELLFKTIQRDGYKSRQELSIAGKAKRPELCEVTVSIGRFGDLLFCDGAIRLAIAKLLDVPAIPVNIAIRHKHWIEFKNELLFYAQNTDQTSTLSIYQPLTHPDLMTDIPYYYYYSATLVNPESPSWASFVLRWQA